MEKNEVKASFDSLKKDDKIIGFDFQGWPVRKITLGEIIESIGFRKCDRDGAEYYEMRADSPIFGVYPIVLEDDGMGYGSNERFVTEIEANDKTGDNHYLSIFAEKAIPNMEMWYDNFILPFTTIEYKGEEVTLVEAINVEGNRYFLGRIYHKGLIPASINIPEKYVKEFVSKKFLKDE